MSIKRRIIIAGRTFFGGSVCIQKGVIYVDGDRVDVESGPKIEIVVQGNLDSMEVDHASSIEVQGSVGKLKSGSGDVKCNSIQGDVSTGSGDIECGDVQGSINTGSGDVHCRNVAGNIRTASGDVTTRRA